MTVRETLPILGFLIGAVLVSLFVTSNVVLNFLVFTLILAIAAQGWNLLGGYGGQYSFGHAAFFGMGAYVSAILQQRFGVNAYPAVAFGIAAAAGLGVNRETIARGLAECLTPAMRLQLREKNGVRWLNDAYNANPESVAAALSSVARMPRGARLWAVLGEMLELGDQSDAAHRQVGRLAAASGVDVLVVVGGDALTPMVEAAARRPT